METEILKIDPHHPDEMLIRKAVKAIDEGKLVAIPTETVYGIACRAANDSIAKLNSLKNRTTEKHYTLHIGKKDDADKFALRINLRAQKLIQNCWPGPLTIVFELSDDDTEKQKKHFRPDTFDILYKNNSIGIRYPENKIASAILQQVVYPVVVPSANITGSQPATNAEEVLSYFNGQIEIVIDGGRCKYNQNSSVVKIDKVGIQILRDGVLPAETINKLSIVKFLFVCSGNTCRSPMAEGIFTKLLTEKLHCNIDQLGEKGYKVLSAGTMGFVGWPASVEAVSACTQFGIDISRHTSTALTAELIDECDYIFVMGRNHYQQVIEMRPEAMQKCSLLADEEINDPIGQTQQVYNDCAKTIYNAVKKRVDEFVI